MLNNFRKLLIRTILLTATISTTMIAANAPASPYAYPPMPAGGAYPPPAFMPEPLPLPPVRRPAPVYGSPYVPAPYAAQSGPMYPAAPVAGIYPPPGAYPPPPPPRYGNSKFGRFFDNGPFNRMGGPFKRGRRHSWETEDDEHFGFFDMIPSDELEELWDDMIAGPPDGDIPGPIDWPSITMPGPFEVGEQFEDVIYETPSFFGKGYNYDN